MLNRKASDPKSRPDQILDALSLQPGQSIADIGAGGGYFSLRFAEAVGTGGMVFAIDIDPRSLEFIKTGAEQRGLSNVRTILAGQSGPGLPEKSMDLVFMRNVTHHLKDRVGYFKNLKGSLRSGGRIAVIDYARSGFFSIRAIFGHCLQKEAVIREMENAGFRLIETHPFLPEQFFMVFSP
jgi:ubiquinone/menaquinone biosynthesis C-methylase UbiE